MNTHKIVTGKPINKTAALVTSEGVHFDPEVKSNRILYDTRPPTRNPNYLEKHNPQFINLKGRRFGNLKVIGISLDVPKRWVVRCDCGKYELMSAKFLKNNKDLFKAKCQVCVYTRKIINASNRYCKWIESGAKKKEDQET